MRGPLIELRQLLAEYIVTMDGLEATQDAKTLQGRIGAVREANGLRQQLPLVRSSQARFLTKVPRRRKLPVKLTITLAEGWPSGG